MKSTAPSRKTPARRRAICTGLLFGVVFIGCTTLVSRLPETSSVAAGAVVALPPVPDFARDVRPVLEQRVIGDTAWTTVTTPTPWDYFPI